MGKIIIKRDIGYADRLRKYKVILNDVEVGQIGNGETKEFDTPIGDNEVFLKIDWCRSDKQHFKSGQDSIERYECGSNLRGVKILLTIMYLFMPRKWIWLRNASNN